MNIDKLEEILESEPGYRKDQAQKAIFKDCILSWDKATFFSLELRKRLNKECPLEIKARVLLSSKKDNIKAIITLNDGIAVETILMKHEGGRNTVCVSCQAGCALGCSFCATGNSGFKRNLTSFEIIEQVLFFSRYLGDQRVTNVVFMGMGEPFLNYDNVLKTVRFLNDEKGFNISARKISISTAGVLDGIKKLAEEGLPLNLAISLHASSDKLRLKLMPSAKENSIKDILKMADCYIAKTGRKVMFEYIMIKDVNDSDQDAKSLVKLLKKPLYFVNLIPCNPVGDFRPSLTPRIKNFKRILKERGISVIQRYRFGRDIKGACGQFSLKK